LGVRHIADILSLYNLSCLKNPIVGRPWLKNRSKCHRRRRRRRRRRKLRIVARRLEG